MATHGRSGLRWFFLGSIAELVVRSTEVPVLTLPVVKMSDQNRRPHHPRKILCPVNYTGVAMNALEHAAALAETFDAELLVLEVVEAATHHASVGEMYRLKQWIPEAMRSRCDCKQLELSSHPAEQILEFARGTWCDLIVVGAQHKRFVDESVIGTTSERVVRFSDVAVLTIAQKAVDVTATVLETTKVAT